MHAQTLAVSSKYVGANQQEQELIRRSVEGDGEAFAKLYRRYHGQVFAFCMRSLQGKMDVEDAVQQVFLEAWRSLYRFEGRSMFSTWLIKIAIHTCLSVYRKRGRILLSANDDDGEDVEEVMWVQPPTQPDEHIWAQSRRLAIEKILKRMTAKKQIVLIMSDMQGMTAPEIASVLGIPDATVRTRLFHARKEFISCVKQNPLYRELFLTVENLDRCQAE